MKMTDEKELPVSQQIAWDSLNDIDLIRKCIPGCETITLRDDDAYDIAITASVGPVRAKFKGRMKIKDIVAPESYALEIEVQGGAVGYGRGEVQVSLRAISSDTTMLSYSANAVVGGKLAQVGARLIDLAAQKMAADFFSAFRTELRRLYGPKQDASSAADDALVSGNGKGISFWSGLAAWFGRLLGGRRTRPQQ
jgi:uncharacterized protein